VSSQTASANGDMIWAFSLNGSPGNRLHPFEAPQPPRSVVEVTGPIAKTNVVTFVDYSFTPSRITVPAGTKVVFTNTGKQFHNAASSDNGGWDTGLLGAGQSASVTFNRPGTYSYACLPHSFMIGQIIVTGAAIESAPPVVVERRVAAPADASPPMPDMPAHNAHPE
jgi:plastocyanin